MFKVCGPKEGLLNRIILTKIYYFRLIVETEGSRALFKGLGPNIVGVAPSRAIYFGAYSQTKASLNKLQ